MKAVTIQTEMKRREDLVNDLSFRTKCAEMAKQIGITAKEWNENKMFIIMTWANEYCGFENKQTNKQGYK
jgi:hypothetical protein